MRKTKQILTILLTFMMVFSVIPPIASPVDAATAKYDAKKLLKGGLDYGYIVTGKTGAVKGYKGVCADPWQHVGTNITGTLYHIPNDHPMARLAYYYYKKGWSLTDTSAHWPSNTSSTRTMRMSHAMSYARVKNGFHTSKTVAQWKSELRSQGVSATNNNYAIKLYETAIDKIGKNDVPEAFDVYLLYNSSKQDGVVWKMQSTFKANMTKEGDSGWADSIDTYANFSDIKYDLYKSDKKTKVGTFTIKKNGTSNTISGLIVGDNYYIKETDTNSRYKLSTNWIGPKTGSKDKTITFKASDEEISGSLEITKKEENGNPLPEGAKFKFHIVHNEDSNFAYDLTLTGDGSSSVSKELNNIPAGKYTITETSMPEGYIDITRTKNVTVKIGETAQVTWTNQLDTPPKGLTIVKTTSDGGDLAGFKFRVTGVLKNEGTINKTNILNTVNPVVTFTNPDLYELGTWTVNDADVTAINNAAKNRQTGTYQVRLTNTVTVNSDPAMSVSRAISESKEAEDIEEEIIEEEEIISEPEIQEEEIVPGEKMSLDGEEPEEELIEELPEEPELNLDNEEKTEIRTIESGTVIEDEGVLYESVSDINYEYILSNDELDEEATEENVKELLKTDSFITLSATQQTIEITVNVNLRDVTYDSTNDVYVATYTNPTGKTSSGTDYSVAYNDFAWNGAATVYRDVTTGEAFSILTTKASGHAYKSGESTEGITKGITLGEYTVTEELTTAQQKKYRRPAAQTKTVTNIEEPVVFEVTNIANPVPFRPKKVSSDGNVSGISFHLTGTDCMGDEYSLTKKTNADGNLNFGNLYSGNYVIEETSFNSEEYTNAYPLDGYDNPARSFSLLTDENGNWSVTFNDGTTQSGNAGQSLIFEFQNTPKVPFYVTKIDEKTQEFLPEATFELYEDGVLVARFKIVENDDGSAGINMLWSNGAITGSMSKTTIDDDDIEIIVDDGDDDEGDDTGGGGDDPDDPGEPDPDDPDDPGDIEIEDYSWARLDGLVSGRHYELRETVPPSEDYGLASPIEFDFEDRAVSVIVEDANTIPIYIKKVTANAAVSNNNSLYSLTGTTFALYQNREDIESGEAYATFTIQANGESEVVEVQTGSDYFLVETQAGPGYSIPDSLKASNGGHSIYIERGMENITIQ